MRALAQSAFINEDDGSPFFWAFFKLRPAMLLQRRMAGSSRPTPARPAAGSSNQLPQNFPNMPGGSARRTRARSSPPRAAQSTSWSRIRAPQDRASVLPRCAATRRHQPRLASRAPASSNRLALPVPPAWPAMHRLPVRAQHPRHFCLALSCCNKLAARRRRVSSASKSRFTPRGLPMPAKLYQTSAYVSYIMRDSIGRMCARRCDSAARVVPLFRFTATLVRHSSTNSFRVMPDRE